MLKQDRINIGIIGCGQWGMNFVRNFSQSPNVQIIGACDIDSKKLLHIRQVYPNLPTFNDYSNLLKNNNLDATVISTPTSTHYRIAKEALLRKKHVLVEKPLTMKTEEAKELINISGKVKKILMVGHTFLYNPAVNKIKEIIRKKQLGRIYYLHSRRTNMGPLRKDVNAIWDLLPHDISIINYLLSAMPEEVSAYAQRFLSHNLEDVGFIILRYPDGILAHTHISWLDPKKIREMTIIGSKKMLVYDDTNINEPIRVYDKNVIKKRCTREYRTFEEFRLIIKEGEVNIPKLNMQEPLKIECRHFIDCIINHQRPLTDAYTGLAVVKVLEAIDMSLSLNNNTIKIK